MRKFQPIRIIIWALTMILTPYVSAPAPATGDPSIRKVLILNSYQAGMPFSDEEMRGIRSALPDSVDVFIEYMDAKRISSQEYLSLLLQIYALKYADKRFDLIFSMDDDALRFLIRHHGQLFPDTPVVFCGVNNFQDGMLDNQPLFTGVIETIDIAASITLGLELLPQTRQVLVITDNTTTGRNNRAFLERFLREGRISAQCIFLDPGDGLTLSELLQKLKSGPSGSIVYYADFFQDRQGNALNASTVMRQVSAISPGPVFVHGALYLGCGAVGGKLNSGFYQGRPQVILHCGSGRAKSRRPYRWCATMSTGTCLTGKS